MSWEKTLLKIEVIRKDESERRARRLARLRERNVALDDELMSAVAEIISEVRQRGDAALIDYTARFDGVRLERAGLRVSEQTLHQAARRADPAVVEALREAIKR